MTRYNSDMNDTKPQDQAHRIGKMMSILTWLILLALLTFFFSNWLEEQRNPNQTVAGKTTDNGIREVVLERNRSGHYVANGRLNGQSVTFLLDTGASDVAVPAQLAEQLSLKPISGIIYQTANGSVRGYSTVIDKIELGNIVLNNIRGGINPGMQGKDILLGMSFLKQLEFTQRGKQLIIRQYP